MRSGPFRILAFLSVLYSVGDIRSGYTEIYFGGN